MKEIDHIFFDLDHTLWDYEKSARETLKEIFQEHELDQAGLTHKKFISTFYEVNDHLWHLYNHGKVDRDYIKQSRFVEIFEKLDVDPSLSSHASSFFLENCSTKPHLIDDAMVVLEYLHERYELHIITNGFEDSQRNKIRASKIDHFFDVVVTSESIGFKKPSLEIFDYSMEKANARASNSLMIGDNPKTDIDGARNAGMSTVLFDPSGRRRSVADHSIQSLLELIKLF